MASFEPVDLGNRPTPRQDAAGALDLKSVLTGVERGLILEALRESRGNKAKAARALGISERLMGIRVKRLGIDWRGMRTRRQRPAAPTP